MASYGLTIPLGGLPLHAQRDLISQLPDLGYTDVWSAEAGGTDAFTPLALSSVWAPTLRLGTAIVPAFTRGAPTIAQSAAALADAAPGRVVVGIGSSSDVIVQRWNGIAFDRPGMAERLVPYRAKLLVLLQFDGSDTRANLVLRRSRPGRVRHRLLSRLERLEVPMQLTMTLAAGVNEREVAWVVNQGARHRNVRVVALQPAFFSGRYEIDADPMRRATLSDASMYSEPCAESRRPMISGRMPLGSRKPMRPWPTIIATTANPPRQRLYIDVSAAKMSPADALGVPPRASSLASTLSSTSESELVLR